MPFLGGSGISYSGFVWGEDTADLSGSLDYIGSSQWATDTGYYEIRPAGYTANNYIINYVSDSLRIKQRTLTLHYSGKDTITYGDHIQLSDYTPTINNMASADTFKYGHITFDNDTSTSGNLTVGKHQIETGEAYILNGNKDTVTHNYIFETKEIDFHIVPKTLSVSAQAEDKTYDKSPLAKIKNVTLHGLIAGDSILLMNSSSGLFANDDAANNVEVIPDSMYIWGTDTGNYNFIAPTTLQASIFKRPIQYFIDTVSDKIYNGTDAIPHITKTLTHDTIYADSILFSYELAFENKNAGTNWDIITKQWVISGKESTNYLLLPYLGDSANISPKDLNIKATDSTKTYDGYLFSGGKNIICEGFVAGEDTSNLNGNLYYSGSSQNALDTGYYTIEPYGFSSNNYAISYTDGILRINPRILTIHYYGIDTITYGQKIKAEEKLKYNAVDSDLANRDSFYVGHLSFGNDTSSSGHLIAGNHDLEIGKAYILNTAQDTMTHNYLYNFIPQSLWVNKKIVSISGDPQNKVYDNTIKALVSNAEIDSIIKGDDVFVNKDSWGHFEQENVNKNINVYTSSIPLLGVDSSNYIINPMQILAADITPRILNYQVDSIQDKYYDGTDTLASTVYAYTGDTIFEDSIRLDFALKFASHNAGSYSFVPDAWQISGPEVDNYMLMPYAGDSATIHKAELYFTVKDTMRFYGSENPVFYYEIDNFVAGENITVLDQLPEINCLLTPKTFVGTYTNAIGLSGGNDNNYHYHFDPADLTINKVRININFLAKDTLMYGTEADRNDYTVDTGQMVNNDSIYLGEIDFGNDRSSSGHLNVGRHNILPGKITVKDETGTSDVSINYAISFNPDYIVYTPKPIEADWTAISKEYDGNSEAIIKFNKFKGLITGDSVLLDSDSSAIESKDDQQYISALFSDKNAAESKTVTPIKTRFTGVDLKNYSITLPELYADIRPRSISWFGNAKDKVYDGNTIAKIDTTGLLRTIAGDDITMTYTKANFSQAGAGNNLSVILSDITTVGSDKDNYELELNTPLQANIHKAELSVQLEDFQYIYGDSLPAMQYTYSGFVNNENQSVIDQAAVLMTAIDSKFDVGYYTIDIGNASDNNYNINYKSAQARILPRHTNITYMGPEKLCENDPVNITDFKADNLAPNDELSAQQLDISIEKDDSLSYGLKYHIEGGESTIKNEHQRVVNDNYLITIAPQEIEILEIPGPALGDNLEFCGICEYDFDAGEGVSYLWSTGDTTRYIHVQGNYRGDIWVRVQNSNNCWNTDTVAISVESKYLKDFVVAFIYPNPNAGEFKVEMSHHVTDYAYIYDMTGNLMQQIAVDGYDFTVNINVPDGAYVLEIRDAKELFVVENSVFSRPGN